MAATNPNFPRSSGILLHPTSLPGRYGIGDLGEWAYRFVDWLEAAGQTVWQVLPLGPTSYGDSPYQSLSAFAGNPLLISFDTLLEEGWLTEEDVADAPEYSPYLVDFGSVITYHNAVLKKAYSRFEAASPEQWGVFDEWRAENVSWLPDFALFVALKNEHGGRPWSEWPEGEVLRQPEALEAARKRLSREIGEQSFRQWLFYRQWTALKNYANDKGIRLVGDIPIFVAHDSADVWANRQYFTLNETGLPTLIAGVPPDYFSPTGQRWGNPLYRWDRLAEDGYRWWVERVKAALETVDLVRIDHFRGFAAYWEIPASEPTAVKGQWVPGPSFDLFEVLKRELGENLPIIAEDLGVITPDVEELRDRLGLPGMRILQFAFGGSGGENRFLPHNHEPNSIVYTGTHDNNTTLGWWVGGEATPDIKDYLTDYVGHEITEPHWDLIRLGMMSVAHTFVAPLQDVWGFGADTRMNTPGRESGNWGWRFSPEWLMHPAKDRLARLTEVFGRWPESDEEEEGEDGERPQE